MSEMADQQNHLLTSGHLPSLPCLRSVWENISHFFHYPQPGENSCLPLSWCHCCYSSKQILCPLFFIRMMEVAKKSIITVCSSCCLQCTVICLFTFNYFVFSDHGNDVQVPQAKLEFLSVEAAQVWNTDFIINKIMWLGCRYDGVIDRASGFLLEDHRLMTWPCYCIYFF